VAIGLVGLSAGLIFVLLDRLRDLLRHPIQ
jgi:hypothetical protein